MSASMVDYAALAQQAGAISSQPAAGGVDYAALAKQAGATSSAPAPAKPALQSYDPAKFGRYTTESDYPTWATKQPTIGPNSKPGEYEAWTGAHLSPAETLAASGKAVATGASVALPIITAGASVPVQAAIQGGAAAAQSKLQGGSNAESAISGAVGAGLGAFAGAGGPLEDIVPSVAKAKASALFTEAEKAVGHIPINVSEVGDVALRTKDLAESGGQMPKVIRNFLTRVTDPNKPPLTFSEARDFYSNASRLSGSEMAGFNPTIQRQVGQFRAALGKALQDTADVGNYGDRYQQAMHLYRSAARNSEWIHNAAKAAGWAGAGAAGTAAASYLWHKVGQLAQQTVGEGLAP